MELNSIPKTGTYADGVDRHNDNYAKIDLELQTLRNLSISYKGYFSSESFLTSAFPSPKIGDYAYAGTPYPGTIYECRVNGSWVDTGEAPDVPEADLNNWIQTDF